MPTSLRPLLSPDSARSGLSLGAIEGIVDPADAALFQAYVNMVVTAPGAALLAWGDEAICLAYNRSYRTLASFRTSVLGKPLLRAQAEFERGWRARLEQALGGQSVMIPTAEIPVSPGEARMGWLLPVLDPACVVKGVLILFVEVTPVVDQLRRVMSSAAGDFRDALVGVRVVTERLARAPKLNVERLGADLGRVLELTSTMERTAEDLNTFSRFAGGAGLQVTLRPGDLGTLVRAASDELLATMEPVASSRPGSGGASSVYESIPPSAGKPPSSSEGSGASSGPRPVSSASIPVGTGSISVRPSASANPIRLTVAEVRGSWDHDAIRRIVINLVGVARKYGLEGGEVRVDVSATLEGGMLAVRGDGKGFRDEELAQLLDPIARQPASADRRRSTANLGLFIARELVQAHGGRLTVERAGASGFVIRAALPLGPSSPAPGASSRRP
jgi:signal transduction histidine kinase